MPAIVTFEVDPYRIVEIDTGGDNELDWQEIYSEWKVWVKSNPGHPQAFRYVGADPVTAIKNLGTTFFLMSPWQFRPAESSHRLRLVGNIWTDPPGGTIVAPTLGPYTAVVEYEVSTLVESAVARLDLAQLQEKVYLDTVDGDDGGAGTPTDPVQTLARAFEVATENKLQAISIDGSVTMDRSVSGWSFCGTISPATASLDFNSYDLSKCRFQELTLTGDAVDSDIVVEACLLDSLSSVTGHFSRCGLLGITTPGNGSTTTLVECFSEVAGSGAPVIDCALGQADDLQLRAYSGGVTLTNIDQPTQDVSVDLISGHLVLDSSCNAGVVVLRGVGKLTDNSGGSLTLDKLGFVGMPHDDPHQMKWMYELVRRAMLEAYSAGL